MKCITRIYKVMGIIFSLAIALVLGACAFVDAEPQLVYHSFGFDARIDSKDIEVLAFQYGKNNSPQTKAPFWKDEIVVRQGTNTHGGMWVGDSLYVKWRNKTTKEVSEVIVDLRPLLPKDMNLQEVYFVIQGDQLFIYLRDLGRKKNQAEPIVGPFLIQLHPTRQIYP